MGNFTDQVDNEMKCQYSKPYAKPKPIICHQEATEIIDFGITKAHVCEKHFLRFWENVYPLLACENISG